MAVLSLFTVQAAFSQGNPYGMDIHSPTGPDLTSYMDKLQAAGVGWAHVAVIWPYVEGSRGVYDWSVYDAIVSAAQARNINILATILYTPAWATKDPTWTGVPDTAAWTGFCTQAAHRYKGRIDYWGLWNEPNLAEFWSGSRQQYIDLLLKPGADAIHAANPSAHVGGPALAHLKSARWYDWLNDVISQAGGHLDFVTHHVYDTGGNRQVTSKLNDSTTFGGTPSLWSVEAPSVQEVLRHAHWSGKPFWLTETGWQTAAAGEELQARYYAGMLSDWFTNYPGQTWIGKIFFYEMQDFPPNGSTWGILRADGTPKKAYFAFRDFIAGGPPSSTDNAQLVAANLPKTMDAGQTVTVSVTLRNTGTSIWTSDAGHKLGAVGDKDFFALPRQLLAAGESIAPGQQKTFTFDFTAPALPATYSTRWQMLREGVAWFGDQLTQEVTVNPAPSAKERTLALLGGRFAVTVSWHDGQSGNAGFGRAVPGTDETGTFWFFSAQNTELVVKILDARVVNNRFWLFYGALSDVEYWVTATDLVRGTVARYYNPPGNLCGKADTDTFGPGGAAAVPPGAAVPQGQSDKAGEGPLQAVDRSVALPRSEIFSTLAANPAASSPSGSCVASSQNLCLLGSRFEVKVDWSALGTSGSGTAAPLSDLTGTFAFFDPRAVELVVKVLDGRALTGKFWFFYGALSDVAYTITLTDTVTGSSKRYHNRQGNLCGLGDTAALD
ncbi:MAG TPA: NBR1-Ig-like domain-containing protein [Thermoanaerobaculia bacterium]|nr:NBR1-Ig-like domain-containing protein [Thermoanaerobaculia bacterium]